MIYKYFIFYNGRINWHSCINIEDCQVRYNDLISFFLEKLQEQQNEIETIDNLNVFIVKNLESEKVFNLSDNIPFDTTGITEIFLDSKSIQTKIKKAASIQQYPSKIIEEGKLFAEKSDYRTALEFFTAADAFGSLESIKVLYKLERWSQLEQCVPRLLAIYAGNPEVYQIYGACLEYYNYPLKALHQYRRALSFGENPDIQAAIARIHLARGDVTQARLTITNILEIYDYNPNVITVSIRIAIKLENFETAIRLSLRHPKCYKLLAEICDIPTGLSVFYEQIKICNRYPKGLSTIARVLYKHGSPDAAINILHNYFVDVDREILVTSTLLWILLQERRYSNFVEYAQQFLSVHPLETFAHIQSSELEMMIRTSNDDRHHGYYKKLQNMLPDVHHEQTYFVAILLIYFNLNRLLPESRAIYNMAYCLIEKLKNDKEYYDVYRVASKISNWSVDISEDLNTIYIIPIIGDEFSLLAGKEPTLVSTNHYYFMPNPIPGISLCKLFNSKNTTLRKRFFSALNEFSDKNIIIITIGTNDCETELPKLFRKGCFSSFSDAARNLIDLFYELLVKYKEQHPNISIYVHPVYPRSFIMKPICDRFNRELMSACPKSIAFLNSLSDFFDDNSLNSQKDVERYQRIFRQTFKENLIAQQGLAQAE